jgi:phosphoglycolate phosphatase
MRPQGIIFDKDGTLFDFEATWSGAMERLLARLAPDDDGHAARALGFDPIRKEFHPDSIAIAGTARDTGRALSPVVGRSVEDIVEIMDQIATATTMVPVVDLLACFKALRRLCPLAVVTNDSEVPANRHISEAGLTDFVTCVIGFDSGHGVKPDPDPLLACADMMGVDPARVLMVGDSLHDLHAGRAAGMGTVGVLTGIAETPELQPFADVVLPNIGHLKAWIESVSAN